MYKISVSNYRQILWPSKGKGITMGKWLIRVHNKVMKKWLGEEDGTTTVRLLRALM